MYLREIFIWAVAQIMVSVAIMIYPTENAFILIVPWRTAVVIPSSVEELVRWLCSECFRQGCNKAEIGPVKALIPSVRLRRP
jgi:hypothetical protein